MKFILIKKKWQQNFSIAYHKFVPEYYRFAVFVVIIPQLIQNSSFLYFFVVCGLENEIKLHNVPTFVLTILGYECMFDGHNRKMVF